MIHPLDLGPDRPGSTSPEEIDPLLLLPLSEEERFFTSLPERQPVQPWPLAVSLLIQVAIAVFIYYQWDKIELSPDHVAAAVRKFARNANPEERPTQVLMMPRLPSSLNRMPPPASGMPPPPPDRSASAPAKPAPPEAPETERSREAMRKYTHINQDEQAQQKPNEKNLFSDRDRKGASPDVSAHPDKRNPDPVSLGTDIRRNALSAPGPNVPGEPGTKDKLAGAKGRDKSSGANGENGTKMAENRGRPAFDPSSESHSGVPLAPGASRYPQGRTGSDAPAPPTVAGRAADGLTDRSGDATRKKPGDPGDPGEVGSDGESGQVSIRRQLAELARQGASGTYRNPTGKNYQMGSMSFDTQGYELGDYDRQVHQAVEREWNPPSVSMGLGIHGCTLVTFVIEKSGKVSDVTLINTSGTEPYDMAALTAIRNARIPKLPPAVKLQRMTTTFGFFINEGMSDVCGTPLKGK